MNLQGDQIRLLRLNVDSSLSFKRVSLSDPSRPPFVALSYVWGDLTDTLPLNNVSGQTIQATRNLHHVLDCLFSSHFDEFLWIDALCIDQQDQHERASQVALMGEIYSHAQYVLAFLSPQSGLFHLGLDYIEATARDTMMHFDPSISPHLTVQGLSARDKPLQDSIIGFFAAPWWTRVWTVQEFLLARKVIFRCGNRLIDSDIVRKACRAWIDHENSCCWAARRPIDGSAHGFLDIPSEINGGLTIYTATLRMKHLMDMLIPGKLFTEDFLAAISLFRVRHCSDPRDRAFGYFGLRSPGLDVKAEIPIDYTVSIADLYKNLAVALIKKSQTLDVLSHVLHESGIKKRTEGLPSWVPDWDATIDDRYHLTYTERTNIIRHCHASGDMKPDWRVQNSGRVVTRGLQIAVIEATAPGYPSIIPGSTLRGKTVISEWRRLAGLSTYRDASPIDMPSCIEQERAFENALGGGFSMKWPQGSFEYTDAYHAWLEWFVSSEVALAKSCKQVIQDFDELIRQTSERRRFIVTSDGQIGFGPEGAEKGDVIMIIPGGKVPYVLRDVGDSGCGVKKYSLLGDAFINSVMAGEKISSPVSEFTRIVII
ncbi:heterokaryon incompatibility (het-6OR allele) [Fusarium tjaetaba]|uniref:Heterokaryon incompatibility (Het-6OR allele) n=1 Tax=Fusarium tjaetaba TaxID=1567544 RepID=A0A8H5RL05_9HYPO|nr:heterokaryon incompatibility (het-6OR allele) [Fusarium tjaetaba]KAF5633876.1 heterokaryon incompatibility (het-6OR allele) [Fusarium tjaetaba]